MRSVVIIIFSLLFISCGDNSVQIGPDIYSPKIVIEGYLIPEKKVENIRITRNFPLNTTPNPYTLILSTANVRIIDLQKNKEYKLSYNPQKYSYEYNGSDLFIDYNKSYKLIVTAYVDDRKLEASSITITPEKGFKIIKEECILDSMKYREKDNSGNIKNFEIVFTPSIGTEFYLFSIVALEADTANFIFDNPYFNVDMKDLKKYFDYYKYQLKWLQNINSSVTRINYKVDWLDTWFYGKYRIIVYAGDNNFRKFILTYRNVQEIDGNFHDPEMNIDRDGIGVFGSYIADTLYFKVLK